jgi:hypothetical protein
MSQTSEFVEKVHYAMAHIHIPMIRKPDGSFDSLTDYITINLEKINEIPAKPLIKMNNAYIKIKLDEMFSIPVSNEVDDQIFGSEKNGTEEYSVNVPPEVETQQSIQNENAAASTMRKLGETLLNKKGKKKSGKKELKARSPSPDFKVKN